MFDFMTRLSPGTRIMAIAALVIVLSCSALFLVTNQQVGSVSRTEQQAEVNHAASVLVYLAAQQGTPALSGGTLVFGTRPATGNTTVVDQVARLTGASAALFVARPDGMLVSISSSLTDRDGRRAVGTVLHGAVATAFAQGRDYSGVDPTLSGNSVAHYTVIRDASGRAIGYAAASMPLTGLTDVTRQMEGTTLVIILIALAIGLGLLLTVLLPLGNVITQLTAAATLVAHGDTNLTLLAKRRDAVGEMILAFQAMVDHLVDAEQQSHESADALARSVTRLVEELAPAAEGDLTARPTIAAEAGDIAVVADFTGVLINSFADVTRRVRHASRQVQTNGEQLAAHIQQLSQAAQERTAEVNETAAIADKIADTAAEVLRAVEQVNHASQEAAQSVDQGNAAVAQTLDRMDAMRATMIQATRQIKRLSDSSLAMNDTVGLVLQFAGDLELLADNAQIEAARHSEAGGVFTAVAEQTGRLAEDAQKALIDIQAAVLKNRRETVEVGRQMEQVATEVVASARAVEEARAAFTKITQAMGELANFVDHVNGVTRTQVHVANTVTVAMEQITVFFAQTAAGVRVSEMEARQLHQTIDGLRDSIANLKVDDETLVDRAVA